MIRGLACLFWLLSAAGAFAQDCAEDRLDLRMDGSTVRFQIEIADTPAERAKGLMHRESMPQFTGMLFIYERPQPVAFWMKNTLIPLDMLFMDETGTVRRIARDTTPMSTKTVPGGDDILYVLEINAGLSEMLGLDEGAEMRHPSVDPSVAAWTCESD